MSEELRIVGILVDNRALKALEVQNVLTRHGSGILMRCGMPEVSKEDGIITLLMNGGEKEYAVMENELRKIEGVSVKSMIMQKRY